VEQQVASEEQKKMLLPKQPEVNIGTSGHVDHGKCLAWDEFVLVNGIPMSGEEIEQLAIQKGKMLEKIDSGQFYQLDDCEVISLGRNLIPRAAKALFYIQHYDGIIYRIKTKNGREIAVTPEHPLLVNSSGILRWVKAKELKLGNYVSFLSQISLGEGISFPDPFQEMEKSYEILSYSEFRRFLISTMSFTKLSALSQNEIEKIRILASLQAKDLHSKISQRTWDEITGRSKKINTVTSDRLANYLRRLSPNLLEEGEFLCIERERKNVWRLREFDVDEEIAKWFAFILSKGKLDKRGISLLLETKFVNDFLSITKKKIGVEVKKYSRRLRIDCKPLIDYLRFKFGLRGGRYGLQIQPWVCKIKEREKATFLRWLFTLNSKFSSRKGELSIARKEKKDIVIISYLLSDFGIEPRFRIRKKGKDCYVLVISGKKNIRRFAEKIGLESEEKSSFDKYLKSPDDMCEDELIPVDAEMLNFVISQVSILQRDLNISTINFSKELMDECSKGFVSVNKLKSLIDKIERTLDIARRIAHAEEEILNKVGYSNLETQKIEKMVKRVRAYLTQLSNLISSQIRFESVESISAERYCGKIFDMTVPENANFICGLGAFISHNTTLVQAITGKWASAHSEELKRGITIKVGYADAAFYKCSYEQDPESYSTSNVCPICGRETKLLRAVSFVDCPGHESLMTNMLAGAFLMDGALLVIAANEPVPKPQTREHLLALQMLGMKRIVIVQNKIDLVSDEEAKKNYDSIKAFVSNTVASDAPIIPISAQQRVNIDALIEALEKRIPTPERDKNANALMYVVRSFDVNKPGTDAKDLSGGVLGGSLVRGELRVGDEIEIKPGLMDEKTGKYEAIVTKVSSLGTGAGVTDKVGPGGLVAVGTYLDPFYTKGDQMVGSVVGKPGTLPPLWNKLTLQLDLFETVVGLAETTRVEKVKYNETLRLNVGTATTMGIVTSAKESQIEIELKKPVVVEVGMRAAISRKIAERWRLIGSGIVK
jgi:translation initiation factor 2 subunit 3